MPGRLRTSRSSSTSDRSDGTQPSSVDSFDDYPALSFPGYAEKPLKDQLEPIAVCGMGCRLPGDIDNPSKFWDLIINKGTGNTPKVPADRFNIDAYIHKNNDRPGSFGVLGGYFLNGDLGDFDPALFNITPIEAMWMDPQQRKLLEVVYESLESAGVSLEAISGTRTAVFAATFTADWQQMSFKEPSFRHSLAATGVDPGILSNRISHVFNLSGPSIVVNTACSSSVYALHNACNALRNNECEGAIVGGVNLIITVDQHMNTAKLGVLSPTSTCHTFDESADGYGRADAVGAVYLKRLSDALRDGDPVRGVIRSSAVNSNGKVPAVGITHPNREGQADVISQAYKRGGDLDPRLTGYFECHGTGTAIGDPLEVNAVAMAMNKERDPTENDPLWIGAVKTNIGHSEAASGLSALIKAILAVERGVIPPTRGLVKPNPKINWKEWQVRVPTEPVPFPRHLPVRRVSINSFGYGGTNAHVIVEGADSLVRTPQAYTFVDSNAPSKKLSAPRRALERRRPFLLPFSAHDKATLKRNIDAHAAVVDRYSLHDLSYTLANRRSNLASRAFTVASHTTVGAVFGDEARTAFSFADKKKTPTVGFVFTGQGAQWPRMGAELMEQYPSFLRSIRLLDQALGDLPDGPDWSVEDVLLDAPENSRVNEAEFSQPLCTAVQVAMVQLLASWGVRPVVTVGHSSGEMAAAYAAGLLSAKQAIVAAYYRGKVVRDVNTGGAMMAVGLGAEAVVPYLAGVEDKVVVACHNSPSGVTLSGDADALDTVKAKLDAESIFARLVKTNGKAYHSHHMAPVAEKYEGLVRAASTHIAFDLPLATQARMVSSVTNAVLPAGTVLDEAYWSANLRSPVLFNQAVQTILTDDQFSHVDLLIEVGPHSAMAGPIKQIKAELKAEKLDYLPTLLRGQDSAVQLLKTAGELFLRNYRLDMGRLTLVETPTADGAKMAKGVQGRTIVDLPPYQWNYAKPLWAESRASREQRLPPFPRHDVLGQLVIGCSLAEPTWRNVLRARDLPWLKHHFLGGESVFPAAGYFAMAIEAITQLHELAGKPASDISAYVVRDVTIDKALVTPDNDDGVEVMLNMRRAALDGSRWWDFGVTSVDGEGVQKQHMTGSISIRTGAAGGDKPKPRAVPEFPQRATGKAWNQALREVGFDYGPTFQDMDDIRFDGRHYEASSRTNVKQQVDETLGESRYVLHPASVDSTLQLCIAAIYAGRTTAMDCGVVPTKMDEMTIWPPTKAQVAAQKGSAYAWVDRRGTRTCETSVQMLADDGDMVMEIKKVQTTSYEAAVPQRLEADLKEAPYGEMKWDLDIDSLGKAGAPVDDAMTVTRLANLALFKRPDTEVLHLVTDPSSVSNAIQVLRENPRASYTIAVSTDDDVEAAQAHLSDFPKAKAVKLSLTDDLEEQGLKPESYDLLIIAAGEAPATETLATLRQLVKKGGRAIWESGGKAQSTTMGASGEQSDQIHAGTIQLVYRNKPADVVHQVMQALQRLGCSVEVCSLAACPSATPRDNVVMLSDLEDSALLPTLTETELAAIQSITNTASTLLWVTAGGLLEGKKPEHAMVSGLARSIRSEQVSLDFRTLDLDLETVSPAEIPNSIVKVVKLQLSGEEAPEREFCISGSNTYISRMVRIPQLNDVFSASQDAKDKKFAPGDRISGLVRQGKIVFQEQAGEDEMRPGHVEVQAHYGALSREGVSSITGVDYPTTFSHAVGGIVTRVGSGVTSHKVGDKVVGFHADKFSSFQQIPEAMATKVEGKDVMEASVGMLTSYMAALYSLETLASIKPGENVLVLHGTGNVGTAAVRVAQMSGAVPFVVVNSEAEAEFLTSHLGLPKTNTIQLSDATSVSQRLADITNGKGADIVLSAGHVDAGEAREAWRHIAPFGRFVDAGRKLLGRSALDSAPVARGASYLSVDLLELHERRPEALAAMLPRIVHMARHGSIVAPGLATRVLLADIDHAVASFSDEFGAPSTVVAYEPSETPIHVLGSREPVRFSPDATYLLVGCLGGLGRSLTSWMMEAGARRFTFLSRSGTDNKSAAKLVSDIEAAGAIVQVVRGDATSKDDVVRAVQGVSSKHPIRGVVHAAMVLRDGLFHSMRFADWKTSVQPKIVGAANLHSVLSHTPLDFFIMTSSVSGILGTPGQSNYAAANSYLDSLARHRRAQGDNSQVAMSLVLPMVLGVGVVAENAALEDALTRKGMYGIDEEHLLQGFEAAVLVSSGAAGADSATTPDHLVVGLDPSKLQRAIHSAEEGGDVDCFWMADTRFSHAVHDIRSGDSAAGGSGSGQSILATIKAAASDPDEAVRAVTEHFVEKLSRMLLLAEDEFEEVDTRSIASYGVDSMVGAELRNWIFTEYRMDVPFQQILGPSLTVPKFAAQVCATHGVGVEEEA